MKFPIHPITESAHPYCKRTFDASSLGGPVQMMQVQEEDQTYLGSLADADDGTDLARHDFATDGFAPPLNAR